MAEMNLLLAACRAADPEFCAEVVLDLHDVQFQLCEYEKRGSGAVRATRRRRAASPRPTIHVAAAASPRPTRRGRTRVRGGSGAPRRHRGDRAAGRVSAASAARTSPRRRRRGPQVLSRGPRRPRALRVAVPSGPRDRRVRGGPASGRVPIPRGRGGVAHSARRVTLCSTLHAPGAAHARRVTPSSSRPRRPPRPFLLAAVPPPSHPIRHSVRIEHRAPDKNS